MRVRLDDLGVERGGRHLVHGVSLDLAPGRTCGVIGPNGSGKSTMLGCLYRALRPTSGRAVVDGRDVREGALAEQARAVSALAQHEGLDLDFTVREVVALGRHPHPADEATDRRVVDEAMAATDATHLADRAVTTLSGGERQRVMVARVLAQQTPVVVLDEPTNHLDLRHQWQLVPRIARSGATVLMALHDLNLAVALCDELVLMAGGRLVAAGPAREVLTADLVEEVYGLRPVVVPHPATGTPHYLFTGRA